MFTHTTGYRPAYECRAPYKRARNATTARVRGYPTTGFAPACECRAPVKPPREAASPMSEQSVKPEVVVFGLLTPPKASQNAVGLRTKGTPTKRALFPDDTLTELELVAREFEPHEM